MLTKNEASANKTLIFVTKYIDDLLQQCKSGKREHIELDTKLEANYKLLKSTCQKIINLLTKISKSAASQIQSGSSGGADATCNKDVMQTFLLTISIEFFRMFDTFTNSQQVVEDLEICFEKFSADLSGSQNASKKNGKHVKSSGGGMQNGHGHNHDHDEDDEEPGRLMTSNKSSHTKATSLRLNFFCLLEWIDVLVEMLLNLFTINKNWIRNIVRNQFRKLFPKLTFNSVKLIIEVDLFFFVLSFLKY